MIGEEVLGEAPGHHCRGGMVAWGQGHYVPRWVKKSMPYLRNADFPVCYRSGWPRTLRGLSGGRELEKVMFLASRPMTPTHPRQHGRRGTDSARRRGGSTDATVRKALAEEYTYAALFARLPGVK